MLNTISKMKKALVFMVIMFFGVASLYAQELKIDKKHSEVGFSIKHLMITNVKGKFTKYDGELKFNPKTKKFEQFEAYVETDSIDTGIVKRDNHLRSKDFFDVRIYPKMIFMMDRYQADGNEGIMYGTLTIHGVTKKVKLNVEYNGTIVGMRGETRYAFTIEGKINRKDFGLKWNKALETGGVVVGDKVKILIELATVAKK